MRNDHTYYYKEMPDSRFCLDINYNDRLRRGADMKEHWHEHMQVYYFTEGEACLECNHRRFHVSQNSIAIINSNELHYLESLSDGLKFYVIRIDSTFLFSNQADLCQAKYLAPLSQNLILFENIIENDSTVLSCVKSVIGEFQAKKVGYELAIKSLIYQLIVLLLRGYVGKILTEEEFAAKVSDFKRFESVFHTLETCYSEQINIRQLAGQMNVSPSHFCRIFKQLTGKTTTDYINGIRLEKAAACLEQSKDTVTEIALKCGFDSINYFSRLFRKYYHISPTEYRTAYEKGLTQ